MATRLSPRIIVWVLLCVWLFASTITLGTAVLMLYIYDKTLESFFGGPLTRLVQTSVIILAGWTLVTFGAAIRTAKANRRSLAMVFFLFSLLGFAGEMLILIALARYREHIFGLPLLKEAILRLVKDYDKSPVARSALDAIHTRFDCCGVDEWHREWKQVPPYPPRRDPLNQEPWVPHSCCLGISKINPTCGFARIRPPVTAAQVVKQEEHGLQTVIPAPWYSRIQNEPCPEKMFEWLAEVPIYILMLSLTVSVSRMMLTVHAVFAYTDSRKRKPTKSR
ncbi:hypothetical protein AHF37_11044 [Paragonimus kellicotti]|nr:hypothetical protein AHF37_11044 [Paragonimus kellicotti]